MNYKARILFGETEYNFDFNKDTLNTKSQVNEPSEFKAELNLDNVPNFNYNDKVKVFITKDGVEIQVFTGFIYSSNIKDNHLVIFGKDPLDDLKTKKLTADFRGFTPQDIFYHLAKIVNLNPKVQGTVFDGKQYNFTIIIPVKNLNINNAVFQFDDVEFSKQLPEKTKNTILISDFENKFFSDTITFAKTNIVAIDFMDAYTMCHKKVEFALDRLSYLKNYSWSKLEDIPIEWDKKLKKSRPETTTSFYGEIKDINRVIILDTILETTTDALVLNEDSVKVTKRLESLMDKAYKTGQNNIIFAMHWLRRARDFGQMDDKLLDYFTSIEMLLSAQETKKLFKLKEIMEDLRCAVKDLLDEEQLNRFNEHLNKINEPSFMLRFDSFLIEQGISINTEEKKNVEILRKKRNDLIHGKSNVAILEEELQLFDNTIQKMISAKIMTICPRKN